MITEDQLEQQCLDWFKELGGVVDQIIRLNATAPRLSAALRDFLANRHTQSYDFV
ncbi:hypothetical protein C8J23_1539 [Shewanella chilikensis]|uniref:Uncharacterized protein n=1 Tax=Shewanella chilikensis TaxID=558541 RepID=A0ABX5PHY0_9GAMM|nr:MULTISPECIES: hypothetical protein [Shewanella]MCL1155226.1 hypothetical protein [Shewanella chilikensis]PYE54004.1 hypothetical protein C8J23_1539 [Shewanella chilikensis]GGZ35890.1 hypothetical protein GCM10007105_23880 [Shewanella chilikensis]